MPVDEFLDQFSAPAPSSIATIDGLAVERAILHLSSAPSGKVLPLLDSYAAPAQ